MNADILFGGGVGVGVIMCSSCHPVKTDLNWPARKVHSRTQSSHSQAMTFDTMLDDEVECVGEAVSVVRSHRNNKRHDGT